MSQGGRFNAIALERVVFGRPAAEVLPGEIERIGRGRACLLVSESLRSSTEVVAQVEAALGTAAAGTYAGMPPHTPREAVIDCANLARACDADVIVTLGGGSLTDAGKIVQLCLEHGVTETEGLDAFVTRTAADGTMQAPDIRAPRIRQITLPTTLSGGEFGFGAGCTDAARRVKQMYRHPLFVPQVVVLDPALTVHTPEWLWLSTGIRAVDHAVETLCSPRATAHSDGPALHALRLLGSGLRRSKADPTDLDARLDCQLGVWASMEHNQDGIPMGASHGIGHVLGGTCGVPHGHTSCVMLPAVLDWNQAFNSEAQARVSEALGRPGIPASQAVDELIRELGLPRSLAEVGVGRDQFDEVAKNAMHDRYIHTNPRSIRGPEDVLQILELAA
tara:strand:- start:1774 stop:2946 length:1173 start_codon:yes stop_codon:yes gene_type:complete